MPLQIVNQTGERSPYKVTTFADYLKSIGVPPEEARSLATLIPAVAADLAVEEIDTDRLRGIGHDLADLGSARLALENLLRRAAPVVPETRAIEPVSGTPSRASIFAAPVQPLLDQAAVLRDVNPALSALLTPLTNFVRAVAEETLAAGSGPLLETLAEAGIAASRLEQVRAMLVAGSLPLRSTALANRVAKQLAISGLVVGPDGDAGPALQQALFDANAELFPIDGDFGPVASGYYAIASVDRPSIVDAQRYAAVGLVAAAFRPVDLGDDLYATESTYDPGIGAVLCLEKADVPENAPILNPGYRADIDGHDPLAGFANSLAVGINLFLYQFILTEQTDFPFAADLRELLETNKDKIKEAIDKLAEDAGEAAKAGAIGAGFGPLSGLAEKLTEQVIKAGLNKLYEVVLDALGGSAFTPVSIIQLVNWRPGQWPETIFRLDVSGRTDNVLIYPIARSQQFPDNSSTLLENDRGLPRYELGGPKLDFLYHSRYMKGASHDPAKRAPTDLWRKVGAKRQPAIWAETAANEGFHLLVPVTEIGGEGLYVWSFRADLRMVPVGPPA